MNRPTPEWVIDHAASIETIPMEDWTGRECAVHVCHHPDCAGDQQGLVIDDPRRHAYTRPGRSAAA